MISLSPGQEAAFDRIMQWYKSDRQIYVLAGYAGTGKTTLAKAIAAEVDALTLHGTQPTEFVAYTGKAANVLREKGCDSRTIHSALYALIDHNRKIITELEEQIRTAQTDNNMARLDALLVLLEEKRVTYRKPIFALDPDTTLKQAKLVIVDEYSMLDQKLIDDLQKSANKILYLGDPFQLGPVKPANGKDESPLTPDDFLKEIHRQAENSPIIRAATAVRLGKKLAFNDEGDFSYQPQSKVAPEVFTGVDQLIVGRVKTRIAWNRRFREKRGFDPESLPLAGDKMMCLKNNAVMGLFNGMIGYATADARGPGDDKYTLDFDNMHGLPVYMGDVLGVDKYDGYDSYHRTLERFDYAYAITCHKSQGSEFDTLAIFNEPIGKTEEMRRRWIYTAITRGKNKVTLVQPRG